MSLDPLVLLAERFSAAISAAFPEAFPPGAPAPDPLIAPAKNPQFGDYQSNAAMGLGKKLGKPPRDVAAAIVAKADLGDLAEPLTQAGIAGPGFINITLRGGAMGRLLGELDTPHLGVPPAPEPQTVVVDLMGVNLAKQMHVGHLRSPIIGDALARSIERLGHRVVRQNHVGDWGLPIAMTTARIIRLCDAGHLSLDRLTLDDLDAAYRDAQMECQRDSAGLDAARRFGLGPKALAELEEQVAGATEAFMAARQALLKLQAREEPFYGVWRRIYDVTMRVCIDACRRMHVNVTEADTAGESSYAEEMPQVVADLVARGIAVEDQGALIVRLDDPPRGEDGQPLWEAVKEPVLVRKTDGGFLYATTDIAAIRRRVQKIGAHRLVYAIDARQSLQMRQVYAASIKAGYAIHPATRRPALMQHAAFGAVLGEDGRPFKTAAARSSGWRTCWRKPPAAPARPSAPPRNAGRKRSTPPSSTRSARRWAWPRSSTPTFPTTAPAITSSPSTACSPSRATPGRTCSTR